MTNQFEMFLYVLLVDEHVGQIGKSVAVLFLEKANLLKKD